KRPVEGVNVSPSSLRALTRHAMIKDTYWNLLQDGPTRSQLLEVLRKLYPILRGRESVALWWVNQGATYKDARKLGFIWAPLANKAGQSVFHWENVSKVRLGDLILNYAEGSLRAISVAKSEPYEAKKELGGDEWPDNGWKVDLEYYELKRPIGIA